MFRPVARIDRGGGGHWPRNGVWGCATLKTPFSCLSCSLQGSHFKQKSQFTRPLLRKFGNFSLYSLNFAQILAHKPPNLEIFSSQAPKFGTFSLQALFFRDKYQFASPTLRKSGPHPPTWKRVECPPPPPGIDGLCGTSKMWTFWDQSLTLLQKPYFWPILWLKVNILADVRGSGVTGTPDFWPGKFCLPIPGKERQGKKGKM